MLTFIAPTTVQQSGRSKKDDFEFGSPMPELQQHSRLGAPPKFMKTQSQKEAWNTFSDELPWLNKSHPSTAKRIAMFGQYTKEMAELSTKRTV